MASINTNTQQQIYNGTGAANSPRDEYWFKVNESSVNSSSHTGVYSVTYCGTDTSSTGTYWHHMSRVTLKVNNSVVATLQNSDVAMGNRYTSGSKYIYQSSGQHTTNTYTLGPLKAGDKVSVTLDSWVNSYPVATYSVTYDINVSSNLYTSDSGSSGGDSNNTGGGGSGNVTPSPSETWYTITYNDNGGYGGPGTEYKKQYNTYYISYNIPSKDPLINTTYTEFTITPNANGGYFPNFNYSLTAAKANTTTTYYSFSKWTTSSNGSGTIYNPGTSYTSNRDLTLYAQWTSSSSTDTYYYNNSLDSLPIPAREGYTFKGWSTSSTGSITTTNPTSSVTLYAIWEKVNIDYVIDIYVDGKWKKAIPYVYSGGWKKAQAYVYIDKTLTETNYYTDKNGNYYTDKNGNYYIQSISTFSPGWHLCGDPYS